MQKISSEVWNTEKERDRESLPKISKKNLYYNFWGSWERMRKASGYMTQLKQGESKEATQVKEIV